MQLTKQQESKIDPLLKDILPHTERDEVLQVVMVLEDEEGKTVTGETLKPSDFSSRVEYRKALIEQRKQQLERGNIGKTIEELNQLNLTIHGGKASRFLVVEGTAEEIVKSLALSGVKSASLDQIIRSEPLPINEEWVKSLSELILSIFPENSEQVYQATRRYIRQYYKDYGQLKVLGMRHPMKLEDIYTTVKVLPQSLISNFSDLDGISKVFKDKNALNIDDKQDGLIVANEYQYLTVLGAPGSGKSTFLRKIGLEFIKGKLEHNLIPVLIELKRFTDIDNIDLLAVIIDLFKQCEFPDAEKLVKEGLKQGKFIILLDGLDEVPQKTVNLVIDETKKFIINPINSHNQEENKSHERNKNHFIISCRTAAYKQKFNQFNDVIIAEFDEMQIKQFINNWFSSETDKRAETAQKCWDKLQENKGVQELAKTPLLLTFICLVYDQSQTLPKNISELYQKALEILLEKWSAEKRLERDPIYQNFTTQLEIMLLSEIAYEGFVIDKLFFETEELVTKIKQFLARNLNAPQDLDGEAVLNAIAIQQGILVERLDNIYSFSHLTLQEYLTAKYLVDNHLIVETVDKYALDTRWKEVFILVAGLMEGKTGADVLLLEIETKPLSYLKSLPNNHRFLQLLEWGERKTKDSPANLTPVAKRVIAMYFALLNVFSFSFYYSYLLAYASDIASIYAFSYVQKYDYDYSYNIITLMLNHLFKNSDITHNINKIALKGYISWIDDIEQLILVSELDLLQLKEKLEQIKKLLPNEDQPQEDQQNFAKCILKTWLTAFDLSLDMINLSEEELKTICQKYFYPYYLTLKCKKSAVLVTDETWKGIEERMYRVPDF